MPYHHTSQYTAPFHSFAQDQRRIFIVRLDLHNQNRDLTKNHVAVLRALLDRLGESGQLDPSHETLARDARCCERTVREALRRGNRLGLVSWVRRLVRIGSVVRQTSNAYTLHLGDAPMVTRCPGRTCRENTPSMSKQEEWANAQRQIALAMGWAAEARGS